MFKAWEDWRKWRGQTFFFFFLMERLITWDSEIKRERERAHIGEQTGRECNLQCWLCISLMGALGERNGREGVLVITAILLTLQSCIIHHCKVALVNILNLFTTLFQPFTWQRTCEYICLCCRRHVVHGFVLKGVLRISFIYFLFLHLQSLIILIYSKRVTVELIRWGLRALC